MRMFLTPHILHGICVILTSGCRDSDKLSFKISLVSPKFPIFFYSIHLLNNLISLLKILHNSVILKASSNATTFMMIFLVAPDTDEASCF